MFTLNQMPLLPGQQNRPVAQVAADNLKSIGVSGGAFALHVGDIIKFPDEEPLVVSQKIRETEDSPVAYYVAVERNGKPSWLSVSTLTRRDGHNEPIDAIRKELSYLPSFAEVYNSLRGKSIKCTEMKTVDLAVFENGQRVDGKFQQRPMGVVEYA